MLCMVYHFGSQLWMVGRGFLKDLKFTQADGESISFWHDVKVGESPMEYALTLFLDGLADTFPCFVAGCAKNCHFVKACLCGVLVEMLAGSIKSTRFTLFCSVQEASTRAEGHVNIKRSSWGVS